MLYICTQITTTKFLSLKLIIMKNHLTKTINGKSFTWATREFCKRAAQKKAKEFRAQGFLARVIDECVYICSK